MRLTVNDVNYNIERTGSGEPLLLLHGFTGSVNTWNSHAAVFGTQFSTVAIDFLGHGTSDAPDDAEWYSMEWCVHDLLSILDQLEIGRVRLLGYSMGGRVALSFANAHPERVGSLVLESASPGIEDADERERRVKSDTELADTIEQNGVEKFVEDWAAIPLFATQARFPDSIREELRRQRLANNALGLANSLRGLSVGRQESLWQRLPMIDVPTLVMAGGLDKKYSGIAQQMAQAMPRARCEIIPNAGHTIHLERPGDFDALVMGFLREIGD